MIWVGYAWLTAVTVFIVASVIYGYLILLDMQQEWEERRRTEDAKGAESKKKRPVSRPTGPEDSPYWKEWASNE